MALRFLLDIGDVVSIDNDRVQIRNLPKTGRRTFLEFIADRSIRIKKRSPQRRERTKEDGPLPEREELP